MKVIIKSIAKAPIPVYSTLQRKLYVWIEYIISKQKMTTPEIPEFSFGVIADVQYADIDNKLNFEKTAWRNYRQALHKLDDAVTKWNCSKHPINLLLDLGDLIDGFSGLSNSSYDALVKVEAKLDKFRGAGGIHHTWGNHEFYNFTREELRKTYLFSSNCDTTYYHFSPHPKLRMVVLDAYDVSMIGERIDSPVYKQAVKILQGVNPNECMLSPDGLHGMDRRYSKVNGAFGKEQLEWLDNVLEAAGKAGEWIIVMAHIPIHEPSSYSFCLSWNFDEILNILHKHPCVKIYMAGHDHDGGYAEDDHGLHHITVRGTVEALADEDPSITAHVYSNRIVFHNAGPRRAPIDEIVINF